jgi:adenine-specific DNA-methyltransferase
MEHKVTLLIKDSSLSLDHPTAEEGNLLIEGDNLDALEALAFTHQNQVAFICIDPPYNTRQTNKDWGYQDKLKHDEWVDMMRARLRAAEEVLTPNGVIAIFIDDNELPRLWLLCDEIFGAKNRLGTCMVRKNSQGSRNNVRNTIPQQWDAVLVYSMDREAMCLNPIKVDEKEKKNKLCEECATSLEAADKKEPKPKKKTKKTDEKWRDFSAYSGNVSAKNNPNLIYPIYADPNTGEVSLEESDRHTLLVTPGVNHSKGFEKAWRHTAEAAKTHGVENFRARCNQKGRWIIEAKKKRVVKAEEKGITHRTDFITDWMDSAQVCNKNGEKRLKELLGKSGAFPNPKPVEVIRVLTETFTEPDSIVLDFFAGSGTTAEAVLEQNKRDNGDRKFILVNEAEDEENKVKAICRKVTLERLKALQPEYPFSVAGYTLMKIRHYDGDIFSERVWDHVTDTLNIRRLSFPDDSESEKVFLGEEGDTDNLWIPEVLMIKEGE